MVSTCMQGQVIRCNRQLGESCLQPLDILYLTRDAVARVPAFQTLAHLRLRREDDLDRRRRWARTGGERRAPW